MKKILIIIALLNVTFMVTPVSAGPASNALATCMVDSLNGKERKLLAKWIFLGMAAHPEMSQLSNVTKELQAGSDKYIGELVTRLLADDCSAEAKSALETESSIALATAFELVGKVAMQELMTNKEVSVALSGFEKHLDKEKLEVLN
ncbi:MAG: hypothetical protein AB8G18_02800 [Gammaproteobacteria bacterium]